MSTVKESYRSAYPEPLKLPIGEQVTVGTKVSEWPGWLWCTDSNGKSGWVPEAYIQRQGATGVVTVAYDATELSAETAEEVEVVRQESGWAWCRKTNGDEGWLPLDVLEP
jgi:uncharacterized protein YgiM (DUF1202 family)